MKSNTKYIHIILPHSLNIFIISLGIFNKQKSHTTRSGHMASLYTNISFFVPSKKQTVKCFKSCTSIISSTICISSGTKTSIFPSWVNSIICFPLIFSRELPPSIICFQCSNNLSLFCTV